MPHLVTSTFFGQAFWLLISFSVLYILVSKLLLPSVARVVDARADQISGDIAQAEALTNDSLKANEKYESTHAKANAEARKTMEEALKKTEANIETKRKELQAKVDKSLAEAEKKIIAIQEESSGVVSKISGEIAKVMADKAAA